MRHATILRQRLISWQVPAAGPVFALVILVAIVGEGVLFARAMHAGTGGRWILPLDDAYIHQQYAVQAATGHPFRYNDGAPRTSGATSLVYPFILAVAWRLGFRGDSLSAFAFLLGGAFLFASTLMAARVAQRLHGMVGVALRRIPRLWITALVVLLVLANGPLLWACYSGMEGSLFILLMLATLDAYLAADARRVTLCGAALALTRPEGLILVAIVALVAVAQRLRRPMAKPAWSWRYVLPAVAGLAQPLLNLTLTGALSPNGMRAKSWLYNVPFRLLPILKSMALTAVEVWSVFLMGVESWGLRALPGYLLGTGKGVFLSMPPLLAAVGILCLVLLTVRDWKERHVGGPAVFTLWITVGLCAAAAMGTALWHFYRYVLPYLVLGLVAGTVALALLAERLGKEGPGAAVFAVVGLFMVVASARSIPGWLWLFQEATRTTLNQQVRMGEWINDHLPAGAIVGVHDVGAVRYYGQRTTYDLVGLTEPPITSTAWRNGSGSIFEAMERSARRPDFFAIYDDVYALPFFLHTDLFHERLLEARDRNLADVASASDHQVIYAADWRLLHSSDVIYQPDLQDSTRGLQLIDSLDVADLEDERSHGYRWWQSQLKPGFPSDVYQLAYHAPPHQEVLDGGRLLTGGESFDLNTIPGQPMLLIGRFLGQSAVSLHVEVNGRPFGRWGYGAIPGRWQEQALRIPAAYVTGTRTRVEIQVEPGQPGLEFHRPFYYWCYQGGAMAPAPAIGKRLDAAVGDGIVLLGYTLSLTRTESAHELTLDLYWQAASPVAGDYKVFVHWSGAQDAILAQQDNRPAHDLRPTWLWQPAEVIADRYALRLPLDVAPSGKTVLYVGMYDPITWGRLPIAGGDAAHRLPLETIELP